MKRGFMLVIFLIGIAILAIVMTITMVRTISSQKTAGTTTVQESQKTLDNIQNKLSNDQKEQLKQIEP